MTNNAELSKKIVIAYKPSDSNMVCGFLGSLGRRLESYRPKSKKNNSLEVIPRMPFLFISGLNYLNSD